MSTTTKTYGKGARLFCDFHFGGKPKAVCLEVLKPGNGKDSRGELRIRLTEDAGAYRNGEEMTIDSFSAVPVKQEFRKRGSFFRWVNTNYTWIL